MVRMVSNSTTSTYHCPGIGSHVGGRVCSWCHNTEPCQEVKDIDHASLEQLPQYLASPYREVRKAAKARFEELQKVIQKVIQGDNPMVYAAYSGRKVFNCFHLGGRGKDQACGWCAYTEPCQAVIDMSRAPLCQLPQHLASRYPELREAAKARFIELQEGK